MTDRRGCLGALLSLAQRRPTPLQLPRLDGSRYAVADRRAIATAHRAAERCIALLRDPKAPLREGAADQVLAQVVRLSQEVHALGEQLARGRAWLEENSPESIARERTRLELEQLEAGAERQPAIAARLELLDDRGDHVSEVRTRVDRMSATLSGSASHLEAIEARLQRLMMNPESADVRGVIDAVQEQQQVLSSAMEAYSATVRELG